MNEQLIKEKEEIIKSFGIEIEKVEDSVYKVMNTNKELNVDKLKRELNECIFILSTNKHYEKNESGINNLVSSIYYIVTSYDTKLAYKYFFEVGGGDGKAFYIPYKRTNIGAISIDTIFSEDEM